MTQTMKLLALLGVFLVSTGCATAIRGPKQKMKFETDPPGATVSIKGQQPFTTPGEIRLRRADQQEVTITKEGYRTILFDMVANWDGVSLTSMALPGGTAWTATDRATGADLAFYKLSKIKLIPATQPNEPPLRLIQHRGQLYTEEEYRKVLAEEIRYNEQMHIFE